MISLILYLHLYYSFIRISNARKDKTECYKYIPPLDKMFLSSKMNRRPTKTEYSYLDKYYTEKTDSPCAKDVQEMSEHLKFSVMKIQVCI